MFQAIHSLFNCVGNKLKFQFDCYPIGCENPLRALPILEPLVTGLIFAASFTVQM